MSLDVERLVTLVASAGRLVGVQELMRAGNFNPGQQTEVKRALRELVKEGRLERDGKRFGAVGAKYTQVSGPAWRAGKDVAITKINPDAKPIPGERGSRRAALERTLKGEAVEAPQERPTRSQGTERLEPPKRARDEERFQKKPRVEKGKKAPAPGYERGETIEGVINHHPDGFAFVRPLVGKGADVFIPPAEARKALDHDQVVVEVIPERDGRYSGRVLKVKSRTRQLVVGTYVEEGEDAWVEPREREIGVIAVPKTQLARPGDAVKVRLGVGENVLKPHQGLSGEVAGSLGSPDDHSVEVLSVAFSRGFQDEFPPEVMDAADSIALAVSAEEAGEEGRKDLRAMPLVTIDGEDARDFDDAIFVEEKGQGWRLVVAIADVSHYVTENSALDDEGLRRATSVYLPGRVLPMLPERLSNGICSLKPDEDRLCMVADLQIDRSGKTTGSEIYPAVMRSHARCTYTEVHDVLAGKDVPGRTQLKPLFERANELALVLRKMRTARGSVDFDLPETRVELGEDGLPVKLVRRERWESHKLVEECMLAANEAVARFFRERDLPTVNRYHGEPDEERLATFTNLLAAYGVEVPQDGMTSGELNQVLMRLAGHPEQRALHQLALRSMMQAIYTAKDSGHYGLGAEDYLHFTSPIRRYPDLLVHRLLKEHWAAKSRMPSSRLEVEADRLEVLAAQCSERERAAMQCEREVNSLYSCLLVQDKIGEEFDATVCGLTDNGFFVELTELFVEGMVKGETVAPRFEFDPSTYRMTFAGGRVVRVGHEARVVLTSVNLQRKQIDFEVVEFKTQENEERETVGPVDQETERPRGGFDPQERLAKLRRDKVSGGGRKFGGPPSRGAGFKGGRDVPRRREQPPSAESREGGRGSAFRGQKDQPGREPRTSFEPREGGDAAPSGEGRNFDPRARLEQLRQQKGGRGGAPTKSRFGARDDRGGGRKFGGRDDRGGSRGPGGGGGGKFGGRDDRGGPGGGGRDDRGGPGGGGRFGGRDDRGGPGGGRFGGRDDRGGAGGGGRFGARDDRGAPGGGGRFGARDDRGGPGGGGRFGGRDDRGGPAGGGRSGGRDDRGGPGGGRFGARDDRGGPGGGGRFGGRDDRGGPRAAGGRFGQSDTRGGFAGGKGGRFGGRGFPRDEDQARPEEPEAVTGEEIEESNSEAPPKRVEASEQRGGRRFGGDRSGGGGRRGSFGGGSRFGGRGGKGGGRR